MKELYSNGVFDFKQADTISVGDSLPLEETLMMLEEGASDPKAIKLSELAEGKKVVMFGLPGAYTSICSSKHVPNFMERHDELKAHGVDRIICVSVNDPWVMREWAKNMAVDTSKVMMLADGEGLLHSKLGLLQHMPGLGIRCIRYSMLVEDGTVKSLNIEEPGGKSYKISGPARMLEDLERLAKAA